MRITKVYTRKGDDGTTSLGGGQRLLKSALRIAACGDADELNSCLGLALAAGLSPAVAEEVARVQNQLFDLGADLCLLEPDKARFGVKGLEDRHVETFERTMDRLGAVLGPLEEFILPGGTDGASRLHMARTVARRAERTVVALAQAETVGPNIVRYLNRLSDLLFMLAREENRARGVRDVFWKKGS